MKFRGIKIALAAAVAMFTATAANASSNLIVNGDFSAGNTGFSSDYTYVDPTPNSMYPEGLYTITNNPFSVHDLWVNEPGAPTMLIENGYTGNDVGNHAVWQQNGLAGVGGANYVFSASIMNVCCNANFGSNTNAPSEILFQISDNGTDWTTILDYITSPGAVAPLPDDGILTNVSASFTNNFAGAFDIRAIDGLNAASGNDFGITNLSVTDAVPEPATWAMMLFGFGAIGFSMRRRSAVAMA